MGKPKKYSHNQTYLHPIWILNGIGMTPEWIINNQAYTIRLIQMDKKETALTKPLDVWLNSGHSSWSNCALILQGLDHLTSIVTVGIWIIKRSRFHYNFKCFIFVSVGSCFCLKALSLTSVQCILLSLDVYYLNFCTQFCLFFLSIVLLHTNIIHTYPELLETIQFLVLIWWIKLILILFWIVIIL